MLHTVNEPLTQPSAYPVSSKRWNRPSGKLVAACLVLLVPLLPPVANIAEADEASSRTFSFDWEDSTDKKDLVEYIRLMKRGRHYVMRSAEARIRSEGRDDGFRAADLFARAAKLRPEKAEPHYFAAEVLNAWGAEDFVRRTHQAINHYSEFIRLAPKDPRVPDALFVRSILLTKLGGEENIKKALADYDVRLRLHNHLSIDPGERGSIALILSNAAELHMYIGDLERAIGLYYDSLEFAGGSAILYSYGLAVALDRDGQRVRARQIMGDSVRRDMLAALSRDTVFFIPNGDIHYYRALGFESIGQKAKAIRYYQQFLRALPDSQYAEQARRNLAALRTPASDGSKSGRGANRKDRKPIDVPGL